MFPFHNRTRSLIPVGDLDKTYTIQTTTSEIHPHHADPQPDDHPAPTRNTTTRRQLLLIYALFLAEALMASSLSSQIPLLLLPSTPTTPACADMNTTFLRSILEGSYFFGSAFGLIWGWAADRLGRRTISLLGLAGMFVCCVGMSFAHTFAAFALLRVLGGVVSSGVNVSGLAMLADVTHGSRDRVRIVARLPLVVVVGGLGPVVTGLAQMVVGEEGFGEGVEYVGGQILCAGFVGVIALVEVVFLKETLPRRAVFKGDEGVESEKAAFLGQSLDNSSDESLSVSIVEALTDGGTPRPSRIAMTEMVSAPSVFILLASFSVLSLHSSTFEILLPHLGHGPSVNLGLGIPCEWIELVSTIVKASAAYWVLAALPTMASNLGVLGLYRYISLVFPGLYMIVPAMGIFAAVFGTMPWLSAIVSVVAMSAKAALSSSAGTLVLLLVLSAAPDPFSTGTLVGVIYLSQFFKALAVGISGVTFYLSDDHAMVFVNLALWTVLAATAFVGAALTWRMRETPRVGADIPQECLVWEDMFDSSDETPRV